MAVLIIYFPVTAAFFDGLRRTEPGWLELARTMDAGPLAHPAPDPRARGPAGAGLGPARRRRRGADRRRGRRVGRLQRRARLPDAARQCPHAGRPDVRGPPRAGRAWRWPCCCAVDRAGRRAWSAGSPRRSPTLAKEIADGPRPRACCSRLAARCSASLPALAADKLTVMLDWFVNPDHAPLIVAREKGFFADAGPRGRADRPGRPQRSAQAGGGRAGRHRRLLPAAAPPAGRTRACRWCASARWSRRRSTAWSCWPTGRSSRSPTSRAARSASRSAASRTRCWAPCWSSTA